MWYYTMVTLYRSFYKDKMYNQEDRDAPTKYTPCAHKTVIIFSCLRKWRRKEKEQQQRRRRTQHVDRTVYYQQQQTGHERGGLSSVGTMVAANHKHKEHSYRPTDEDITSIRHTPAIERIPPFKTIFRSV